MWQSLKQIISDASGKTSFLRVSSAITLLVILGVFIEKNIVNHGFIDFAPESVMVILVIIGGKVVSGAVESSKEAVMHRTNKENPDESAKDT